MNKLLFLTAFTLFFSPFTNAQDFGWAHSFGSANADVAISTYGDEFGNIFVTGYFSGTVDFDPGPDVVNLTAAGSVDVFVIKLNPEGELIWARRIGGTGTDYGNSIVVDARGYAIIAGFFVNTVDFDPGSGTANMVSVDTTDAFVLKLDPNGKFDWVRQFGGPDRQAAGNVTTDARGNVYVCGTYRGTVDFDPGAGTQEMTPVGGGDVFILKLDWKGNLTWAKSIGGTNNDTEDDLIVDADGFVYTVGEFRGTVDFDPGPGTANLNMIGTYSNTFVQKLDSDGNYVWAKQIGGNHFQYGNEIKISPLGDLLITGSFDGTTDFDPGPETFNLTANTYDIYVLSLTNDGNFNWVRHIVGTGNITDTGESLAIDKNGSIYVCGNFLLSADFNPGSAVHYLTAAGSEDGFLLKLDPAGNFVYARKMGGQYQDQARCLYLDPNGNIYTVGSFWGTADFNPLAEVNNLVSNGGPDIFIQKLIDEWNFVGRVFQDLNANGVLDTDEWGLPNVLVAVPDEELAATTDSAGWYHIYSNIVADSVHLVKARPYWTAAPEFVIADSMQTPMNFAVTIPELPDLCLAAVNVTPFRPGFTTEVRLQIVNTGTVRIDSAMLQLLVVTNEPPGPLEFVSGNPAPEVVSNDHYTWQIGPLDPFQMTNITLILRTLADTPLGTPLTLSAAVGPENDVYLANNASRTVAQVVGSFDPNDKQVSPAALLPEQLDTSTLQYVIRFQNTGNYPAEFVVIRDTLPQGLDLATLQVFGASHPFTWRIYDERVLEFRFDPIVLPDSISDEPGSHGFVVFQIKPRAGLVAGDSIPNAAGIYFDYNAPVITPAAVFKVTDNSSGTSFTEIPALDFGLNPNPASSNGSVNLELPSDAARNDAFIGIYDQQGRVLRQMRVPAGQRQVYLSELPAGVCVVRVGVGGVWGWKILVVR